MGELANCAARPNPPHPRTAQTQAQFDQNPAWKPEKIPLGDGRTLVLEES